MKLIFNSLVRPNLGLISVWFDPSRSKFNSLAWMVVGSAHRKPSSFHLFLSLSRDWHIMSLQATWWLLSLRFSIRTSEFADR